MEKETKEISADNDKSTDICMDIARLEYEYSFKRAEKYDNKVYVLLTVCGFILVMFTGAVRNIGEIDILHPFRSGWIAAYDILLALCVMGMITVLVRLIYGMSGISMRRHDSDTLLKCDMLSKKPSDIALFTPACFARLLCLSPQVSSLPQRTANLLILPEDSQHQYIPASSVRELPR